METQAGPQEKPHVPVKKLSDFSSLAGLEPGDFRKHLDRPVLVLGSPGDPLLANDESMTDTLSGGFSSLKPDRQVVVFDSQGATAGALRIGRDRTADVQLPFQAVSRNHAQLIVDLTGQFFLTDEGSKNGTFINGSKLAPQQKYVLKDGDRVRFGDVEGVFLLPASFHSVLRSTAAAAAT